MSLSVADALRDGLGRTFERNGLQLIGVFVALRLATTVASDTLTRANIELTRELGPVQPGSGAAGFLPSLEEVATPFALGLSLPAALSLVLAVALTAEAARLVAVRTLVSENVETVPADYRRRNIGVATLNGFVGGIVVLTLTGIGLVFLVLPGVFLALAFFFVRQEIAVRDVNFVDAMAGSWELTAGHRLELFALAVAVVLAGLVASVPGLLVGAVSPPAGSVVTAVARAVVVVFGIGATSRAYVQLRNGAEEGEEDRYRGALTADDLPPPETDDAR